MNILDKTIFITGGSAGIGLETVKLLLGEGAKVASFSTSPTPQDLSDGNLISFTGDVRDRQAVKNAIQSTVEKFGSLDILINNAGIAKREWFMDSSEEDWEEVLGVNLKGAFIVAQEAIRVMQKEEGEKMVINISSGAGIHGVDEIAVYSASKAGMIAWTQAINDELKGGNIKFAIVAPGSTGTKMLYDLFPEEKPLNNVNFVAETIVKTIKGELSPDENLIVDVFEHFQNQ